MARHEDESKDETKARKAIKRELDKIPVKPGALKKIEKAIKDKEDRKKK